MCEAPLLKSGAVTGCRLILTLLILKQNLGPTPLGDLLLQYTHWSAHSIPTAKLPSNRDSGWRFIEQSASRLSRDRTDTVSTAY